MFMAWGIKNQDCAQRDTPGQDLVRLSWSRTHQPCGIRAQLQDFCGGLFLGRFDIRRLFLPPLQIALHAKIYFFGAGFFAAFFFAAMTISSRD
jgi:hypothetical protein